MTAMGSRPPHTKPTAPPAPDSPRARRLTILADPFAAAFYAHTGARRVGEAPSDAIPGRLLPLYEIALA